MSSDTENLFENNNLNRFLVWRVRVIGWREYKLNDSDF